MLIVITALIYVFCFGLFGAYVADAKNRSPFEGVFFALLFGPLGLILVASLPTLEPPVEPTGSAPSDDPSRRYSDAEWARKLSDDH